jgi:hypothetical protein
LTRDRGEVRLACQHLIYPMIDDRTSADGASDVHRFVGEYVWTPLHNRFGWECLLGATPGIAGVSPYAAAARAEDLSGLPPSFIAVGALDLFLEEDMDYARRLTRAGVPTELHVYPGAFHGFDAAPQLARTAMAAARDSRDALRRALYGCKARRLCASAPDVDRPRRPAERDPNCRLFARLTCHRGGREDVPTAIRAAAGNDDLDLHRHERRDQRTLL